MSHDFQSRLAVQPRAWPELPVNATFRSCPSDFRVVEQLAFTASGTGEHILIRLCKRGLNTEQVARQLARVAGVPRKAVSYAGLKDRHAETTQYFSVHLPGKPEPRWQQLDGENMQVLEVSRHQRKLRRGALSGNHFVIILRDVTGPVAEIENRLQQIQSSGTPNYFAGQRFGIAAGNLYSAAAMLLGGQRVRDRFQRGIYLSAARAWLFNLVLAERIRSNNWNLAVPGDSMMLDHSRACFVVHELDAELHARVEKLAIHPTGPLWGKGDQMVQAEALSLERKALEPWQDWCDALQRHGLEMARRRLRIVADGLTWRWLADDTLELEFGLTPGAYATAVLREITSLR